MENLQTTEEVSVGDHLAQLILREYVPRSPEQLRRDLIYNLLDKESATAADESTNLVLL